MCVLTVVVCVNELCAFNVVYGLSVAVDGLNVSIGGVQTFVGVV